MKFSHTPVMPKETMQFLAPQKGGVYVDCTLGGGGHAELILKLIGKSGRLIGIDQDEEALAAARKNLEKYDEQMIYINDNFANLDSIMDKLGYDKVDGIMIDLGVSSFQLDSKERGFSFMADKDAPLDMRMDQRQKLDAYEVVNYYTPEELQKILFEYGEEKFTKSIVKEIINSRKEKHIETTGDLVKLIERATPPNYRFSKKPGLFASNTFRAIRMEVNNELGVIRQILPASIKRLTSGGRLVVLTFQSLEDRIVKNVFREFGTEKSISPISRETIPATVNMLTRKPIEPSETEKGVNPRSNCAKLRAIEKI